MAIKGYRMPLEAKDLWSMNPRDSSKVMVPKLLKEWEKEQSKAKRYVDQKRCFTRCLRPHEITLLLLELQSIIIVYN